MRAVGGKPHCVKCPVMFAFGVGLAVTTIRSGPLFRLTTFRCPMGSWYTRSNMVP
jgi:hypothetical protein